MMFITFIKWIAFTVVVLDGFAYVAEKMDGGSNEFNSVFGVITGIMLRIFVYYQFYVNVL